MRPGLRVFLDTQIVTCFPFVEQPDAFVPPGCESADYYVLMPVVRELERIKDEHYSAGQRARASSCLEMLEDASHYDGTPMAGKKGCRLFFRHKEPSDHQLASHGVRGETPDDRLVGNILVLSYQQAAEKTFVLSDDVGVRVRIKGEGVAHLIAYRPPAELRFTPEVFNLPQNVKLAVKELATQIAAALRE